MTDAESAYHKARYRRRRAEGSCKSCGAEAQPKRTRCLPCGLKSAAYAKRRAHGFGVWHGGVLHGESVDGGWLHCPITGERISGTIDRMQQYADDMNALGQWVRPKGAPSTGYAAAPFTRNDQEKKT